MCPHLFAKTAEDWLVEYRDFKAQATSMRRMSRSSANESNPANSLQSLAAAAVAAVGHSDLSDLPPPPIPLIRYLSFVWRVRIGHTFVIYPPPELCLNRRNLQSLQSRYDNSMPSLAWFARQSCNDMLQLGRYIHYLFILNQSDIRKCERVMKSFAERCKNAPISCCTSQWTHLSTSQVNRTQRTWTRSLFSIQPSTALPHLWVPPAPVPASKTT